tara:strand:+ start:477 stop:812 length:336 start_codon:yes stop_codon:yes gene_type:complete
MAAIMTQPSTGTVERNRRSLVELSTGMFLMLIRLDHSSTLVVVPRVLKEVVRNVGRADERGGGFTPARIVFGIPFESNELHNSGIRVRIDFHKLRNHDSWCAFAMAGDAGD